MKSFSKKIFGVPCPELTESAKFHSYRATDFIHAVLTGYKQRPIAVLLFLRGKVDLSVIRKKFLSPST